MDDPGRHTTLSAVFANPDGGMAALGECRAGRFRFNALVDGDVKLTVWTTMDRLDELESIVEAHGGEVKRG